MILRSSRSRFIPAGAFSVGALLSLLPLLSNEPSNRYFGIIMIVLCLVMVYRSLRCGYVYISTSELLVRTIVRTRVFKLVEIKSIAAEGLMQATSRVIPVVELKSGRTYKLTEFFMQKRSYDKSKDLASNPITHMIKVVTEAIEGSS
jgi:hypothetical protein